MEIDEILGNRNNEFSRMFIESTENWDKPWVNDRENPSYTRAIDYKSTPAETLSRIDKLLRETVPKESRLETIPSVMEMMRR